jgi:3-hydroxypropanoate dehydrogenase
MEKKNISEEEDLAQARARIEDYRQRIQQLDEDSLDLMFREARNQNWWQDKPVSDDQLREIWDLSKLGSTSGNCLPARILFLRSKEARVRLTPALGPGNVEKTLAAPVTALIAYDVNFFEYLPRLNPARPELKDHFAGNEALAEDFAYMNGTLQGAYFLMAIRAVGLDAGAMGGFNKKAANEEFFKGTSYRSNFLCNIGYGDISGIKKPRPPRLAFDEACEII